MTLSIDRHRFKTKRRVQRTLAEWVVGSLFIPFLLHSCLVVFNPSKDISRNVSESGSDSAISELRFFLVIYVTYLALFVQCSSALQRAVEEIRSRCGEICSQMDTASQRERKTMVSCGDTIWPNYFTLVLLFTLMSFLSYHRHCH